MYSYKILLAVFLLLAILGVVFAAKDLNRDTDGDGLRDHVDDYDDDNDNIPDVHDEDDDGDGLLDAEVSLTKIYWKESTYLMSHDHKVSQIILSRQCPNSNIIWLNQVCHKELIFLILLRTLTGMDTMRSEL